jgi:hypothetical protein
MRRYQQPQQSDYSGVRHRRTCIEEVQASSALGSLYVGYVDSRYIQYWQFCGGFCIGYGVGPVKHSDLNIIAQKRSNQAHIMLMNYRGAYCRLSCSTVLSRISQITY